MSDACYRIYTRAGGRTRAPSPQLNLLLCLEQLNIFAPGPHLYKAHPAALRLAPSPPPPVFARWQPHL